MNDVMKWEKRGCEYRGEGERSKWKDTTGKETTDRIRVERSIDTG